MVPVNNKYRYFRFNSVVLTNSFLFAAMGLLFSKAFIQRFLNNLIITALVKFCIIFCISLICAINYSQAGNNLVITDAKVGLPSQDTTRFVLQLNNHAGFKIFTLQNPYRLVLDMPSTKWALSRKKISVNRGAIKTVRFGQFNPSISRIVLDLNMPVSIINAYLDYQGPKQVPLAVIDMKSVTKENFHEEAIFLRSGSSKTKIVTDIVTEYKNNNLKQGTKRKNLEFNRASRVNQNVLSKDNLVIPGFHPRLPPERPKHISRPVIVLDPGHGGADPGAMVKGIIKEKTITLKFVNELARQLIISGYEVHLTRSNDKYVSLSNRVSLAESVGADLFISVHADSHPNRSVRGASVYTLSDKASDKEAERLARRENRSDVSENIDISTSYDKEVTEILISLAQQTTMNCSVAFASDLIPSIGNLSLLLRRTHRFAGFRVLKSPEIPSVLVELGYLTNDDDLLLLRSSKYRRVLSRKFVEAVNLFFSSNNC